MPKIKPRNVSFIEWFNRKRRRSKLRKHARKCWKELAEKLNENVVVSSGEVRDMSEPIEGIKSERIKPGEFRF